MELEGCSSNVVQVTLLPVSISLATYPNSCVFSILNIFVLQEELEDKAIRYFGGKKFVKVTVEFLLVQKIGLREAPLRAAIEGKAYNVRDVCTFLDVLTNAGMFSQ